MVLYVNPKGENRRWARHPVLPSVNSEVTVMKDIDADGVPEITYSVNGVMAYAKVDRDNPTAPWSVREVSGPAVGYNHGVGVGDVNGDGRVDILNPAGWWNSRQPLPPGPWVLPSAGVFTMGLGRRLVPAAAR